MNPFFDISIENNLPINNYQLKNLGLQRIYFSIISRHEDTSNHYRKTTEKDYDNLFTDKLWKWSPVYEIDKLLEYHYKFYIETNPDDGDKFLKHIRFVILPKIEVKTKESVHAELIIDWLNSKKNKNTNPPEHTIIHNNTIKIGDINAPVQFQQSSNNSVQTQQFELKRDDINTAFDLIKKDIEKLDAQIRSDFSMEMDYAVAQINKNRDAKPQLSNIGSMMKEIGTGVFTNLAAAPIFEYLKPFFGL